jgi:hypothetical protein
MKRPLHLASGRHANSRVIFHFMKHLFHVRKQKFALLRQAKFLQNVQLASGDLIAPGIARFGCESPKVTDKGRCGTWRQDYAARPEDGQSTHHFLKSLNICAAGAEQVLAIDSLVSLNALLNRTSGRKVTWELKG